MNKEKMKKEIKSFKKDFKKATVFEKIGMLMCIPLVIFLFWYIPFSVETWISIIVLTVLFTALTIFLAKKQVKTSKKLNVGDEVYTKNDFTGTIKGFVTEYDRNEDGLEMAIIETKIPRHILTKKKSGK